MTGGASGQLLFNGQDGRRTHVRRMVGGVSAYITQQDIHLPMLTVRETLEYAARFRLGQVKDVN